MNYKNIIIEKKGKGLLKDFEFSIKQIKTKFEKGKARLNFAKENFNSGVKSEYYDAIFTNIYDASRMMGEAFLGLFNLKAMVKDHHKTIIEIIRTMMKDDDMKNILKRLDKMRKRRHIVDYDFSSSDMSEVTIKKAIEDVEKFANKIAESIKEKDPQQKIM